MDRKEICLLVIDMQNDFLDANSQLFVPKGPSMVKNVRRILDYFRDNNLSRIFIRRFHRKDGSDIDKSRSDIFKSSGGFLVGGTVGVKIIEELNPLPEEIVVNKRRWSAFFGTELDMILRRKGVKTLILTGVQTPNCIRATFYDAVSLDYDVIIIEDGTASGNDEIQKSNLYDMEKMGAKILNTEELIELLKSMN
jgi:nicotinamidase-related amidase